MFTSGITERTKNNSVSIYKSSNCSKVLLRFEYLISLIENFLAGKMENVLVAPKMLLHILTYIKYSELKKFISSSIIAFSLKLLKTIKYFSSRNN